MATLKIMGDALQIKSELTGEQIERVKTFAPEALKLFDTEDNEVFGVEYPADASYSKYGICFCNTDSDGKVFMTTNNPVRDHDDPEKEKEEVVKRFALILNHLNMVEANVAEARAALEQMESAVTNSVTFVE